MQRIDPGTPKRRRMPSNPSDNKERWFLIILMRIKKVWEIALFSWSKPTNAGMKWQSWHYFCPVYFYWSTSWSVGLLIIKDKILSQALLQAQKGSIMTSPYNSVCRRHLLRPDKRSISALALRKADQPLLMWDKQLQVEQREPAEFQLYVLAE